MARDVPRRIAFTDTVLGEGAVERVYTDGRQERRVMEARDRVRWSDSAGNTGIDSDLGGGRIRREDARGAVSEGQHLGNGVTAWNEGAYVTVNETQVPELSPQVPRPGGLRGVLLGLGLGSLFGLGAGAVSAIGIDPAADDYGLYAEEYARQQMRSQVPQAPLAGGDGFDGVNTLYAFTDSFG